MSNVLVCEPYEQVHKVVLKEECRLRGLCIGGTKEYLMMRLRAFDACRRVPHDEEAQEDSQVVSEEEAQEDSQATLSDEKAQEDSQVHDEEAQEDSQAEGDAVSQVVPHESDEAAVLAMQKQLLDEAIAKIVRNLYSEDYQLRNLKRARRALESSAQSPPSCCKKWNSLSGIQRPLETLPAAKLADKMKAMGHLKNPDNFFSEGELRQLYHLHLEEVHGISEAYMGEMLVKVSLQNLCHMLDYGKISKDQLLEVIDYCSICMDGQCIYCAPYDFAGHQRVTAEGHPSLASSTVAPARASASSTARVSVRASASSTVAPE